ncbi:DUF4153 domain-containing protein [Sediminimonas sp.]|uniref:DUF4153 domain-containing protein n=1 Tax=Sediminimonas sp. TaxID=2823379 RepID=UPI0025D78EA1|nr:DUF4153 domain-containing protein [Sediminimonas sp.]
MSRAAPRTSDRAIAGNRLTMALIGIVAGLSLWFLFDRLPEYVTDARLTLFLTSAVAGGFAVMLALAGPVRPLHAGVAAVMLAAPAAALLVWASLRHDTVAAALRSGHLLAAFTGLLFIATPFAAASLSAPRLWHDYATLFDAAWTMVMRYAAAWLFVAIFWGVVLLSDAVLGLVGITLISRLIEVDWFVAAMSGLVLGLALAVVYELREYLSPHLLLRLLRLLLPVVLTVMVVFLAAVAVRGVSGLLGDLSVAGTLLAMALAAVALISVALDCDNGRAVHGRPMRVVVEATALLLPLLVAVAVWALWLRVAQYGWTPNRVVAALSAVVIMAYALLYALAVLRRHHWMNRVRRANVAMALVVAGLCGLWMTPLLNAERIATASQVARFEAGRAALDDLALWEMAHRWGRPGAAGLARLAALQDHPAHAALVARIRQARQSASRETYVRASGTGGDTALALARALPLRPEGESLPHGALAGLAPFFQRQALDACRRALPDGRPGCVLVMAQFNPRNPARQGVMLLRAGERRVIAHAVELHAGRLRRSGGMRELASGRAATLDEAAIARALDGDYAMRPAGMRMIDLGGAGLVPGN